MRYTASNLDIKKMNRNRVLSFLGSVEQTSMPEIAAALGLSMPTILSIVNELKSLGIVEDKGTLKSTGGRKARAVAINHSFSYALGLNITGNHVGIAYTDLSCRALGYTRIRKTFRYVDAYVESLRKIIAEHIAAWKIPEDRIVGMGIALPGIINEEQQLITSAHTLGMGIRNMPCERMTRYMPYPCTILNDANAAAIAESSSRSISDNMVYLSLSNTVGGSVIFQGENPEQEEKCLPFDMRGRMYKGSNWRSAEFGHMVIHPGGRTCYCGKKGCLDAYCSATLLSDQTDGNLEYFFEKVAQGDPQLTAVWNAYMSDLAIAVDNIRMCFDCDVILGGYVGNYMQPYIAKLQEMLAQKDLFGSGGMYVNACCSQIEASALGAAISRIETFLDGI